MLAASFVRSSRDFAARHRGGPAIGESPKKEPQGISPQRYVYGGHCVKRHPPFWHPSQLDRAWTPISRPRRPHSSRAAYTKGKGGEKEERERRDRKKKAAKEHFGNDRPVQIKSENRTDGKREERDRQLFSCVVTFCRVARKTYTRINTYVYVL